jgi:hypothetical protein
MPGTLKAIQEPHRVLRPGALTKEHGLMSPLWPRCYPTFWEGRGDRSGYFSWRVSSQAVRPDQAIGRRSWLCPLRRAMTLGFRNSTSPAGGVVPIS